MSAKRCSACVRGAGLLLIVLAALVSKVAAHDVPNDVTVHAFLEPGGSRAHLLVRAPLGAMRDIDFPKRGTDYLDLARAEPALREAATVWIGREVEVYEGDRRLGEPRIAALLVSLPSDRSFQTFQSAMAHVSGPPLDAATEIVWSQAMLDVLFEYPISSDESPFSIRPGLQPLGQRVTMSLRFIKPDGAVRAFELHDDPGVVRLDPSWHQAVIRFVQLGFEHILGGIDHLLFLLCLVIPLRRVRTLVLVVTAFTAAHSLTLLASAYNFAPGGLWFPPLVETLIATSIVYMALENIVGASVLPSRRARAKAGSRRWAIAFAFGLVHGFGFSFALRDTLQFAGSHLLSSLVSFNVGVEAGQVAVLLVTVPALNLLFRYVVAERVGTIILSALVAHTGWHWMTERGGQLLQFPWPAFDPATAASVVRWMLLAVGASAAVWLLITFRNHRGSAGSAEPTSRAGVITSVVSAFRRT